MNLFLTGGSGFLGSALWPRLICAGHRVLALSRRPRPSVPSLEWVEGDLADPASYRGALRRFHARALVHLAWEGLPNYGDVCSRKNAVQSEQLFDVAAQEGCTTLLGVGSCWEYRHTEGPVDESSPVQTGTPFIEAKTDVR